MEFYIDFYIDFASFGWFLMDNGDDLSFYFGLKKISRKLQEWKFKKKFIKIYIYNYLLFTIRTILVTLSILRS